MSHCAAPLARRVFAEFTGTGLLLAAVVGSGIAATRLSPHQTGLQLAENAAATAAGLAVIILLVGPVSGAHLNPVISLADWLLGRRLRSGLTGHDLAAYLPAQLLGGVAGTALADLMFDVPALSMAGTSRAGPHLWLGEVVATAGLVALVFALVRSGQTQLTPVAVAAWIGSAYWFTSSTAFANPAVTVARSFTDTFTGITPGSVPGFVAGQLVGALLGVGLVAVLYPAASAVTASTVTRARASADPMSPDRQEIP